MDDLNKKRDFGDLLIYQNEKGETKIDAYFLDDTIWMIQKSLASLYQVTTATVNEHITNIFKDVND